MIHRIPRGVPAQKLSRYLRRAWPMAPGWAIRTALKARDVRVNGERAQADRPVAGGDELTLYIDPRFLSGELPVLFEDGRLLAVCKPQGLPVDVDEDGIGADTALLRAQRAYPSARLVHRLDAGTGGVLLFSLTEEMHSALLDAFREGRVDKVYRCVVKGRPESRTLSDYLIKDAARSKVLVRADPVPGAKRAQTRVVAVGPLPDTELSLIEVEILTGRTHQIRAQLAAHGHPLLGDDKYGDRALNQAYRVEWPQLWCVRIALRAGGVLAEYEDHPITSEARFEIRERRVEE